MPVADAYIANNVAPQSERAPDIEQMKRSARRRFLRSFRNRWHSIRGRRSDIIVDPAGNARTRPLGRRRKRTAVALGISALSMAGASQIALSADPAGAENTIHSIDPSERRDASALSASDDLLQAMVEEEGVRYVVYRDVAGYPTVGVGHLVLPQDNLRVGDRIDKQRAMQFLEQDLKKAEQGVRDLVGDLPVNQHEFDALVDLVFNVGIGTVSADESPRLNAAIGAGDYQGIAEELDYTTAKSNVAKGLIHRSERRTQIFMAADYSDPRTIS